VSDIPAAAVYHTAKTMLKMVNSDQKSKSTLEAKQSSLQDELKML
jgi:hypothetical protein